MVEDAEQQEISAYAEFACAVDEARLRLQQRLQAITFPAQAKHGEIAKHAREVASHMTGEFYKMDLMHQVISRHSGATETAITGELRRMVKRGDLEVVGKGKYINRKMK